MRAESENKQMQWKGQEKPDAEYILVLFCERWTEKKHIPVGDTGPSRESNEQALDGMSQAMVVGRILQPDSLSQECFFIYMEISKYEYILVVPKHSSYHFWFWT